MRQQDLAHHASPRAWNSPLLWLHQSRIAGIRLAWTFLLISAGALEVGAIETQAAKAPPLSDYVPPDAALYAEIENLDRDWQLVEASPLGQAWFDSPLWRALAETRPFSRWREIDDVVSEKTGQSLTRHIRGLCAESLAITILLPEDGGEPRGMLLARGHSREAMTETLQQWNRLEAQAVIREITTPHGIYTARKSAGRDGEVYYALVGDIFVFSDHESLVTRTLEQFANGSSADSLSAEPTLEKWRTAPRPPGTLWAFLVPRRWDRVLRQLSDESPPARLLLENWSDTLSVFGSVSLNPSGLQIDLQSNFSEDRTSDAWRNFTLAASRVTSNAPHNIPADALLVAGGSIRLSTLLNTLQPLMSTKDRREWEQVTRIGSTIFLGLNLWEEVADVCLQDWTCSLVVRPFEDQLPLRRHPFVAIWESRLAPSDSESETRLAGLENAITFGTTLLAATFNAEERGPNVTLKRDHSTDNEEWEWLLSGRPEGELAIRLSPDRLLVSTARNWGNHSKSSASDEGSNMSDFAQSRQRDFPSATVYLWTPFHRWSSQSLLEGWLGVLPIDREKPAWLAISSARLLFQEGFLAVTCQPDHMQVRLKATSMESISK